MVVVCNYGLEVKLHNLLPSQKCTHTFSSAEVESFKVKKNDMKKWDQTVTKKSHQSLVYNNAMKLQIVIKYNTLKQVSLLER